MDEVAAGKIDVLVCIDLVVDEVVVTGVKVVDALCLMVEVVAGVDPSFPFMQPETRRTKTMGNTNQIYLFIALLFSARNHKRRQ